MFFTCFPHHCYGLDTIVPSILYTLEHRPVIIAKTETRLNSKTVDNIDLLLMLKYY